jgi:hypothetical protein
MTHARQGKIRRSIQWAPAAGRRYGSSGGNAASPRSASRSDIAPERQKPLLFNRFLSPLPGSCTFCRDRGQRRCAARPRLLSLRPSGTPCFETFPEAGGYCGGEPNLWKAVKLLMEMTRPSAPIVVTLPVTALLRPSLPAVDSWPALVPLKTTIPTVLSGKTLR